MIQKLLQLSKKSRVHHDLSQCCYERASLDFCWLHCFAHVFCLPHVLVFQEAKAIGKSGLKSKFLFKTSWSWNSLWQLGVSNGEIFVLSRKKITSIHQCSWKHGPCFSRFQILSSWKQLEVDNIRWQHKHLQYSPTHRGAIVHWQCDKFTNFGSSWQV